MSEARKLVRRTAVYVSAVEQALAPMNGADREAVLEDVEDHIDAALQDRSGSPTIEHLEAVLAELGSPESYAAELQAQMAPGQGAGRPGPPAVPARLCKQAALGLGWSILFLVVAVPSYLFISVAVEGESPGPTFAQRIFQVLAVCAAIGLVFGPMISALAISKIRASQGRLYGLGPAVLGLYLIPLAVSDVFLFGASNRVLDSLLDGRANLAFGLSLLVLLLAFYWNGRVIRSSIKKLSEPPVSPA